MRICTSRASSRVNSTQRTPARSPWARRAVGRRFPSTSAISPETCPTPKSSRSRGTTMGTIAAGRATVVSAYHRVARPLFAASAIVWASGAGGQTRTAIAPSPASCPSTKPPALTCSPKSKACSEKPGARPAVFLARRSRPIPGDPCFGFPPTSLHVLLRRPPHVTSQRLMSGSFTPAAFATNRHSRQPPARTKATPRVAHSHQCPARYFVNATKERRKRILRAGAL